ncbi:MAG: hypothetical protein LBQ08_00235 [Holosporaceae bacterium]|jgi:pyruvate kinase|nr:hypothetical protein [Holosporaceae bacterium]
MKRNRNGKIIVTIDSDVYTPGNLNKLYAAGVDVFGLNFSSGSHKGYIRICDGIRTIGKKYHTFPTILANLRSLNPEAKDRINWESILNLGVDWIILPPAQNIEEIEMIKNKIDGRAGIISILEKSSVNAFEPMIEATDAILISEGFSTNVQEDIVKACNRLGRPVIIEMRISESVVSAKSKSKIGNMKTVIYPGIDAVMLSIESSPEKHQFEIVELIHSIMGKNEKDSSRIKYTEGVAAAPNKNTIDAICAAAKEAAEFSCANVIVLFTDSLKTILRCSRMRIRIPIILVTESLTLASKSGLCGGIYPAISKKEFNIEQICKTAKTIVLDRGFAAIGDNIVVLDDISGNSVTICRL